MRAEAGDRCLDLHTEGALPVSDPPIEFHPIREGFLEEVMPDLTRPQRGVNLERKERNLRRGGSVLKATPS